MMVRWGGYEKGSEDLSLYKMVEQGCLENGRNCTFGYYSDRNQVSIPAEAIISLMLLCPGSWLLPILQIAKLEWFQLNPICFTIEL
jgi:hypothetical protein